MNELMFKEILNASSPVLVGIVLFLIMAALRAVPQYPNWLLPFTSFALGSLAYPWLEGWSARNFFIGIVIGSFPVGLHQGWRQFLGRKEEVQRGDTEWFSRDRRQDGASRTGDDGPDGRAPEGKTRGKIVFPLLGAGLITALLFLAGCATGPRARDGGTRETRVLPAESVERTAAIVRTSAQLGAYYAVRKDPETRPYFEGARLALDVLLAQGTYEPERVWQALNGTPPQSGSRTNEDAFIAIAAAVNLYTVYFSESVQSQLASAKPVLAALRDGIALGLNTPLAAPR